MTLKTLGALALTAALGATTAVAELVIPDLSYRTGAYAAGGTPFSDGYQDYFNLLNARDGGIGGEMLARTLLAHGPAALTTTLARVDTVSPF